MYGRIDRIWHNQRADGTEYWVLTIDGQRYSTWDPEHVAYVQEGEFVEFSYTNNGNYRNLLAIRRVDDPAPTSLVKTDLNPVAWQRLRMNCLQIAAELLKGTRMNPEQRLNLAIRLARRLEKHVWQSPCGYGEKRSKDGPRRGDVIDKQSKEGGA